MKPVFEKPKIFISHGHAGESLNIFRSFLESLEFEIIVVIDEPSSGMALSEKVKSYIRESDCVLVIATPDNKDEATSTFQPRANVSHEIGYAEALEKPIIYVKHNDVNFGSNYSDKVWIAFSENEYHHSYQQIIEETKKLRLLSIVGKINKDSVKSEIVEKTLRLVDILNVKDSEIKANILYNLSLSLYKDSSELTKKETKDFFDFYPEYSQTCAYDGYKNENLDGAIRLMSFSLQLHPLSSRKVDYISMLSDSLYLGEGMLDEDIKKELNALLMEEARNGNIFNDQMHVEKIGFYLEVLSNENRPLFWGHASHAGNMSQDVVHWLKNLIIGCFAKKKEDLPAYERQFGFPTFVSTTNPFRDSETYEFKTELEQKLEDSGDNEKKLIFRFISQWLTGEDVDGCVALLTNGKKDVASKTIWAIGEAKLPVNAKLIKAFNDIFDRKEHALIGVLATTIGRLKIHNFNDRLVRALEDFDFNSRRRIIWCMGRLASPEFKELLQNLDVETNNYALKDELDQALEALTNV